MKRFAIFIFSIFICTFANGETVNLSWYVDNQVYQTTTCEIGGNVTPPTAPNKKGYTFQEWLTYTPIEYLESTGTQYIDTGYSAPNGYKTSIKLMFSTLPDVSYAIMGSHNATSPWGRNYLLFYSKPPSNRQIRNFYEIGAGGYKDVDFSYINTEYEAYFSTVVNNIFFNGNTVNDLLDAQTTRNQNNLYIFDINGYPFTKFIGRIYYTKIWDPADNLVRDFIPVLDGNATPCMFDKVENKFYYNQGTGQFIAGPVLTE